MPPGRPSGPSCRAGTSPGLDPRQRPCRSVCRCTCCPWTGEHQRSNRRSSWLPGNVQPACGRSVLVASWWRCHEDRTRWSFPDGKLLSLLQRVNPNTTINNTIHIKNHAKSKCNHPDENLLQSFHKQLNCKSCRCIQMQQQQNLRLDPTKSCRQSAKTSNPQRKCFLVDILELPEFPIVAGLQLWSIFQQSRCKCNELQLQTSRYGDCLVETPVNSEDAEQCNWNCNGQTATGWAVRELR